VVSGAGDVIAALFFAHLLREGGTAMAVQKAASSIYGVLKATAEKGSREMLLIEAQDELIDPRSVFASEQLC
jgi:pyridoxine kinase